ELTVADVAWTTQAGRRALPQRWATVCRDVDDLLEALDGNDPRRVLEGTAGAGERPVAFMFSGQGTQHVDMGRGLYKALPAFRKALDACADALVPHLDLDLRKLLFPPKRKARAATAQLTCTEFAQPALFAVEYALARLWADLGVEPAAMAGHSIGEYVAACLAGVFSLEDALALVAARGRLMQALPEGSMLAVPLGADDLAHCLGDDLDLAAANETALAVASGPTPAIEALADRLAADGIEGRVLHTSHAFHSRMMEPMLDDFAGLVAGVERHEPTVAYVSNVTGDWVTAAEATDPGYWARQVRSPVRW